MYLMKPHNVDLTAFADGLFGNAASSSMIWSFGMWPGQQGEAKDKLLKTAPF